MPVDKGKIRRLFLSLGGLLLCAFVWADTPTAVQPDSTPASPPQATQPKGPAGLPAEIKMTLDSEYPGWKLAPVKPEIQQEFHRHPAGHPPSLVWGDFGHNGKRDYVIQILFPSQDIIEQILIAYMQQESSFEETILESRGPNPNIYLGVLKKPGQDDLIVMGEETGQTTYHYDNGRFTEVEGTSDEDDSISNP